MSWLDNIEKDFRDGIYPTSGAILMARVIRELAEYAPIVRLEEKSIAYANLSPDTKELLER